MNVLQRAANFFRRRPAPEPTTTLATLTPPAMLGEPPIDKAMISSVPMSGDSTVLHPGFGLEAVTIRAAFDAAEAGRPAMQCDLFDDICEQSGHLRASVEKRIEGVASETWGVYAGADNTVSAELAQAMEEGLRASIGFDDAIEYQLTHPFIGWAPTEIDWVRMGPVVAPGFFSNVPHRWIAFHRATDEARVLTKAEPTNGVEMLRGRWWITRARGRKTARAGLLRTAAWWSWVRQRTVVDWQVFCRRYGIPFVLGFYEHAKVKEEEMEKLRRTIEEFGRTGGAVLPMHTKIEIKDPASASGTESVHPGLARMCDAEISKLILGGTLTNGEGSSTGSYALGEVHSLAEFKKNLADARRVGNSFSRDIGRSFAEWNAKLFPGAAPPVLRWRLVREVDPVSQMKITASAVNELGLRVSAAQQYERFGLRRPVGDDDVLPGQATAPAATQDTNRGAA